MSAADAAAHIIENPSAPSWFQHPIVVTFVLLMALGAIFLKGFQEAIWLAVALVAAFLVVNFIVIGYELTSLWQHPTAIADWKRNLFAQQGSPAMIALMSLVLFPKLALGLSGFETGVAVMPLVKGEGATPQEALQARIHNTRKLLRTAAGIMSVMLIGSAIVTTMMIPAVEFAPGGRAEGRALAFLAHRDIGEPFATIYDLATIGTLWFAGASALAGLLNLVPQYLPRYGMAPDWARATRPLVLLFTAISLLVTALFSADVTAQGGAYATGVLALITSARRRGGDRAPAPAPVFRADLAHLRLHDGDQRLRAARRHQDRGLVHRDDRRVVARLARRAIDGDPHRRREVRRTRRSLRERIGRAAGRADHRQSAEHGTPRGIRAQARRRETVASPAGRPRAVPRSETGRLRQSSRATWRCEASISPASGCSGARAPPSLMRLPVCCSICGIEPTASPTPTSAGPRAIRSPISLSF
jgi:hypothetical protein